MRKMHTLKFLSQILNKISVFSVVKKMIHGY